MQYINFYYQYMRGKILFIQNGSFSHINRSVENMLSQHFPDCDVIIFDIAQRIRRNRWIFLVNSFFFVKEYFADILFRYKSVKELKSSLFVTSYFFKKVKTKVAAFAAQDDYIFSLQTQSQFDASLPSIPHFIYTDHTLRANFLYPNIDYRNYLKPNGYLLHLEKKVYDRASLIFTYSSNITASLVQQYEVEATRIKTIGIGCNLTPTITSDINKYASKNILFVGVEWNRKGGDILLSSFKQVVRQVPDAQLIIVGCRPPEAVGNNIRVIGRVPLEEMPQYYQQAAVFCMPSRREPFGLVYLEAMAYQLPIVALSVGALPDFVKNNHNGYLVRNSLDAIAEKLIYLITHPDRCRAMGQEGAKIVAERYQWPIVGEKMKQSIMSTLENK